MKDCRHKRFRALSDDDLMQQVRKGRLAAFAVLVERYQKPLLNFFLRLGVDRDAEDLVQQTFLRIYTARESYRPAARFPTFLFCVARNLWIDWLRRECRREDMLLEYREIAATRESSWVSVESYLDVKAALAALPHHLRLVVVLTVYHGLTYREVAEVLDVPIGTVKSRMHAAISRLREFMYADAGRQ